MMKYIENKMLGTPHPLQLKINNLGPFKMCYALRIYSLLMRIS